jgi:hypothetical protein
MTKAAACPDARDLERLARGQLPEPDAEHLGRHVLDCSTCANLLNSFQAGDTLITDLRAALGQPSPDHPVVDALVERFVRRPPDDTLFQATPLPERVPGFEILAELGRGGMGVVLKARQVSLNRVVALKRILAGVGANPEDLARFRREAEVIARLQHPNIVQIYEIGLEPGHPYLVLEFVEGGTLAQKVGGRPQPAREAARLVETLARTVHAVHQRGVVHRDLKPANVLLTADGTPKITDFGLARRLDGESARTHTGAVLGTPSYMAPEQADGRIQDVGPAADVYGLAAVLYEMLTGRPPFKGGSASDTIGQVRTQEPVPPVQLGVKVPCDLEAICLKGLSKEPAGRYASAHDLADDLRRFLDDLPIRARHVPAWERAWKWARRRRAAVFAAACILLSGVAVLAALWHAWSRPPATDRTEPGSRAPGGDRPTRTRAEAAPEATGWKPVPLSLRQIPGRLQCLRSRLLGEVPLLDPPRLEQLKEKRTANGFNPPDVNRYVFESAEFPPSRVPRLVRFPPDQGVRVLVCALESADGDCLYRGSGDDFATPGTVQIRLEKPARAPVRLVAFVFPLHEDASRHVARRGFHGLIGFAEENH